MKRGGHYRWVGTDATHQEGPLGEQLCATGLMAAVLATLMQYPQA